MNKWRRKIPKTSLALSEAESGDIKPAGTDILLEVFGLFSTILFSVFISPAYILLR
jgi:hypothetical protein